MVFLDVQMPEMNGFDVVRQVGAAAMPDVVMSRRTIGLLVHATLQSMLERLDPDVFVRIHRSAIVNVRHILQIETAEQGDYMLTLDNGFSIQSSRTYNDIIKKWVSNRP